MAGKALREAIYICGAKRTPFGKFGGTLRNKTARELQATASRAALVQAGLDAKELDTVVIGNVSISDPMIGYMPRQQSLDIGCKPDIPALAINRLCGSGFQAIVNVALEIEAGLANTGLAGGVEVMSNIPHSIFGARWGSPLGKDISAVDTLWFSLGADKSAPVDYPAMGMTAENLAQKYGITREDADLCAYRSQTRWIDAKKKGYFDAEITPGKKTVSYAGVHQVEVKQKGKTIQFDTDEHPRLTPMEKLATLNPTFKENGTVTAANASGINDGAGGVVLANEVSVKKHGLKPLARLAAFSYVGVEPKFMGIGPVPAIERVMNVGGVTKNDVGIVDINEAFATQFMACAKALDLDHETTNVCGGAVAMGHPLAASGIRITSHLTHALQRQEKIRYAIGSACIGGGQGIAVLLERV